MQEAKEKGFIRQVPHFNSLCKYLSNESLTSLLQELIVESSLPLSAVEQFYAVDSTGLSTAQHRLWFNRHKGQFRNSREWVKLHIMCGVQTNIITFAEVSSRRCHDTRFSEPLVANTARHFTLSEVSTDGGYIDARNHRQVMLLGGIPYIAFRKNSTIHGQPKCTFYKDMLLLYKSRHPEFMAHYYRRNNVESTFSMLKAKFSGQLRSKSERGQINEALCKVLCHNLCVLIQSMFELGIMPTFDAVLNPLPPQPTLPEAMEKLEEQTQTIRENLPPKEKPQKQRRNVWVDDNQLGLFAASSELFALT